jgi:hypothetical protein
MTFIKEREKIILKFLWKNQRPLIAKAVLSKKSNAMEVSKYLISNYTIETFS